MNIRVQHHPDFEGDATITIESLEVDVPCETLRSFSFGSLCKAAKKAVRSIIMKDVVEVPVKSCEDCPAFDGSPGPIYICNICNRRMPAPLRGYSNVVWKECPLKEKEYKLVLAKDAE